MSRAVVSEESQSEPKLHRGRTIVSAVVLAALALLIPSWLVRAGTNDTLVLADHGVEWDTSFDADSDDNGTVDRTMYYQGPVLAAVAWDTTGDGNKDLWFRYASDLVLDREIADLDGDGSPDEVLDVDRDGAITVIESAAGAEETGDAGISWPLLGVGFVAALVAAVAFFKPRKRAAAVLLLVALLPLVVDSRPADAQADLFDEDCTINEEVFEREWMKYSDFDIRIPPESASWEVQQFNSTLEKVKGLMIEQWEIEVEQKYEAEIQDYMRDLKVALAQNQKANLLRSFVRLTALTYNTVKAARSVESSLEKLFAPDVLIEQIGAVLKLYDSFTPKPPKTEFNVRDATKNVGWDTLKDTLESAGDPNSIVKTVIESTITQADAALPSLELSADEIDILRYQYVERKALDATMAETDREQRTRRTRIAAIDKQIAGFEAELENHRNAEKERVRFLLVTECEDGDDTTDDTIHDSTVGTTVETTVSAPEVVTTDSIPDYDPVLGTWRRTDGTTSYEFRDDGTYTFASNDERAEGAYKLITEDDALKLLWLDPDDPSELRAFFKSVVERDGDNLTLITGDTSISYTKGPLIDVAASTTPPPQRIDFATAEVDGSMVGENPTVSYGLDLDSLQGGLDIDLAAGTATGDAVAVFVCSARSCRDETRTATVTATFDMSAATITNKGQRWILEGTSSTRLDWNATIPCATGSCPWQFDTAIDVPFKMELFENLAQGFLTFQSDKVAVGESSVGFALGVDPMFVVE